MNVVFWDQRIKTTGQRGGGRALQARILTWREQRPTGGMNWAHVGNKQASKLNRARSGYKD